MFPEQPRSQKNQEVFTPGKAVPSLSGQGESMDPLGVRAGSNSGSFPPLRYWGLLHKIARSPAGVGWLTGKGVLLVGVGAWGSPSSHREYVRGDISGLPLALAGGTPHCPV